MFTIYTVYFFLLVVAFFLFFIGQLFREKNKGIRYFLQGLGLVIILFMILNDNMKTSTEIRVEQQIAGFYRLDVDSSVYSGTDLHQYANAMIEVKLNNTFVTNRELPFLMEQHGKWLYTDRADYFCLEYSLGDNSQSTETIDYDIWEFKSGDLVNSRSGDFIIFRKVQ